MSTTKPQVEVVQWGTTAKGQAVELHRLINSQRAQVEVVTYGARVRSVAVPDRFGTLGDVVLGCDSLAGYEANTSYLGATVGRYGNRIGGASFELDGSIVELKATRGSNNLHSGPDGFDSQVWSAQSHVVANGATTTLKLISPHGQSGFPGRLEVEITMTWSNDNTLAISYRAETDRPTVCNLTNHSYFDLSAGAAENILGHELWIDADAITEVDAELIPTGRAYPVVGTPFDFRQPTTIGARIEDADQQLECGAGYDHNYVFNSVGGSSPVAVARDLESGRVLEISTSEPGVQFYCGTHLNGSSGGNGRTFGSRSGFCLETQHPPDSPNRPEFPSTVVRPGQTYESRTEYRFGADAIAAPVS